MFHNFSKKVLIDNLQFFLIAIFILSSPYYINNAWIGTFSILLFLLSAFNNPLNLKSIIYEKTILSLLIFVLFSYLSIFWSEADPFSGDFNTNFDRFKYYFLIIPGIYFSNLTQERIRLLLRMVAFAPILLVAINYTNYFDFTSIYSIRHGGDFLFLSHYLVTSVFILFSAIYLYIHLFSTIKAHNYKTAFVYFLLFVIVGTSLFIDERTASRLINLTFIIAIGLIPLFYVSNKIKVPIILFILISSTIYLFNSNSLNRGIQEFSKSIKEDKYQGSWGHRTGFAIVGIKIFMENPIFGRGINDVSSEIVKIKQSEPKYFIGDNAIRFHNGHINFLVQIGLVGYFLLLIFLFTIIKMKINCFDINLFKNMTIFMLLLLMMGEHYLSVKPTTNFLILLISLFILYHKLEYKDKEQSS